MDWDYIASVSADHLTDEKRDDLFNKVTWFDCDSEKITPKDCVALFKIAQELLKYKSIQVETLLSELDEIAAQQGEQEAKKLSDSDAQSLPSKRSSSLDLEELETKYANIKLKYRKLLKALDKLNSEVKALKQTNKLLEQDRLHLQNELQQQQSAGHDNESSSDVSEIVKDQQKELVENLHQKNVHISKLLDDIETVEKDNITLREKLTNIKDELNEGVSQLNQNSSELSTCTLKIVELQDQICALKNENDALKIKEQDMLDDKIDRERQIDEYSHEIEARVDKWKEIIHLKNNELQVLKSKLTNESLVNVRLNASNSSSVSEDVVNIESDVLRKVLIEREAQILQLKTEILNATDDMDLTAFNLTKLKDERDLLLKKHEDLVDLVKDLKGQLRVVHARCQDLQQLLSHAETASLNKDADLRIIIDRIKGDGNFELADLLSQNSEIKSAMSAREKQLADVVRAANKLQKSSDRYLHENVTLRARLGLCQDDHVPLNTNRKVLSKIDMSGDKVRLLSDDERLNYRLEIEKLTKSVGSLANQVVNLGEFRLDCGDMIDKTKYVKVVEENEALRKGLHEILNSVQANETDNLTEIKCQTLEQLLLALDAKHISGWYHPAMRLQAELHTIQGVNSELREQLRNAKLELDECKKSGENIIEEISSKSNSDIIQFLKNHIFDILNNFKTEEAKSGEFVIKLEENRKDFLVIQQQLSVLYKQYSEEKLEWVKNSGDGQIKLAALQEKVEVLENKLQITLDQSNDNDVMTKLFELSENLTISNRKCLYLQDEQIKCVNQTTALRNNLMNLQEHIQNSDKNISGFIENPDVNKLPQKMQKEIDDIVVKYRDLLLKFESFTDISQKEADLLNSIMDTLKKDKQQVVDKLHEALNKLNAFESSYCSVDKAIENLTKKLAQSEINEMTEKQRADHTNNLYELVKEQLKKCEAKLVEKDDFIEALKKKASSSREEDLKQLLDKVMYHIDADVYKDLQNTCVKLEKKLLDISNELTDTKLNLKLSNAKLESGNFWSATDEYKYLSLKHQIVDLQAVSDDKAIIARLSSDVVSARMSEAEMQKRLNLTLVELRDAKDELGECLGNRKIDLEKRQVVVKSISRKNEILEDIVRRLRQEYYGFVPLSAQSRFIENVHNSLQEKQKILETLQKTHAEQQCCLILKEQLTKELENIEELKLAKELKGKYPPLINWYQEKNNLQLQEIKYKRQSEYLDHQLKQANERIKDQDNHILKLEEEHLQFLNNPEELLTKIPYSALSSPKHSSSTTVSSETTTSKAKILKCSETQTYFEFEATAQESAEYESNLNVSLQKDLSEVQMELGTKEKVIEELRSRIKEVEVNINLFKTQLGDKQSQIMFYEKHIVELQSKKEEALSSCRNGDNQTEINNLQSINNELKSTVLEKDTLILNLQTLLKQDRDEHSLAAARMQNELKRLYEIVNSQKTMPLEETDRSVDQSASVVDHELQSTPKLVTEQYILQVHALEKHTTDLHTSVATLTAQLQASREESVRWRALANDRLQIMERFGKEYDKKLIKNKDVLTEHHKGEIENYKRDADKWRQEVVTLQQVINKHRDAFYDMKAEVEKHQLDDKDSRIHELTLKLRQQQSALRKKTAISVEDKKFEEQEMIKEQLLKEHETLKKRFEQLMNRERNAREELHALRTQLIKRPTLSARSDSSVSTQHHQQSQRKIKTLEDEINILQEKIQQQSAIIDSHRAKVSMDFEKWSRQKHYQQLSEKLKLKMGEKQMECEKLLETSAGLRMMVERSEREKHNLEARIKNLKSHSGSVKEVQRFEALSLENVKLIEQLDVLKSKLNAQQHHSGALGAAMLQEKLEAQERKITVMEVAAKGTLEVRMELERLGNALNSVQKTNLRLEAENLELNIDLERNIGEIPHLKEQIVHLESYIAALKVETSAQEHQVTGSGDHGKTTIMSDMKKVVELERTVVVLKRVVDKLQAENKRLINASRPCSDRSDRSSSTDRYRRDYYILKELHATTTRKLADVQQQLDTANVALRQLSASVTRAGSAGSCAVAASVSVVDSRQLGAASISCDTCFYLQGELNRVNEQLAHKAELLEKVKVLLQKAAAKEKGLLYEVANLKSLIPMTSSPVLQ